jgi:osmoprotectant transport system permease protein
VDDGRVALVGYTLVILFPNIVTGLRSAPDEVIEAARGMGLTRLQVLTRVEYRSPCPRSSGPAHRRRLDRRDRDDRRHAAPEGPRLPDLPRAEGADAVQDGDLLRAYSPSHWQSAPISCSSRCGAVVPWSRAADDRRRHREPAHVRRRVPFHRRPPGVPAHKTLEQIELSGAALGLALLAALPLGVVLGHLHRGSGIAIGASIVGRGLPSLVLIAAFLTILGIGFVNNMVALAVLGSGPILTNAYDAVAGVDRDTVEAARGMGMTRAQILQRVELPLAIPALHRTAAAVTIVDRADAAIAGGGLGDIIVNQASYRLEGVLGASFCDGAVCSCAGRLAGSRLWQRPGPTAY